MDSSKSLPVAGLIVPDHEPGSKTPVEIYEQTKRKHKPLQEDFISTLLKTFSRLDSEDDERHRAKNRRGFRVQKFYEGDPYGYWHPVSGEWRSKQIKPRDPFYPHNKIRYYSDGITTQWCQSRPDVQVLPSRNDDHTKGKAIFARHVLDDAEDRHINEEFLQEEGKLGQFYGNMYRLTYWNPLGGTSKALRPKYEQRSKKLADDVWSCGVCGTSGPLTDLIATITPLPNGDLPPIRCLRCRSDRVSILEVPEFKYQEVVGYEEVPVGDWTVESVCSLEVKDDSSVKVFENGLFVRRRRMVRTEILEDLFPWWERSTEKTDSTDNGIELQAMLSHSAGNTGSAASRGSEADRAEMTMITQWWLKPPMYGRWISDKDIPLVNGDVIEANQPCGEAYRKGLYALVVDNQPIDFRDESFTDHWEKTKFILIPNSSDGHGIEDMVRPQEEYNETRSLAVTHVKSNASPPTIIRAPLRKGMFTASPKEIAEINGFSFEYDLNKLVLQLPTKPLDQNTLELNQLADREMQSASKAWSISTGAPDISDAGGLNTATGAKLQDTNAQAMRSPELALRAHGNVRWARQALNLFRLNAIDARYVPFKGKAGDEEGAWFKGSDVEADYFLAVKKRSWMPKNEIDRRDDLMQALAVGGGMVLNPQVPIEWRQAIVDVFDLDIELQDYTLDARNCRLRMDEMAKQSSFAEQMAGQMGNQQIAPLLLLQMVPIEQEADDHAICAQWLKDFIKGDEFRKCSDTVKQATRMRLQEHTQAGIAMAAQLDQATLLATAPSRKAAGDAEDQASAKQHVQDQQKAEADHSRGEETADADHKRQMELQASAPQAPPTQS